MCVEKHTCDRTCRQAWIYIYLLKQTHLYKNFIAFSVAPFCLSIIRRFFFFQFLKLYCYYTSKQILYECCSSLRPRLHGADRIFGRSNIWPLRPSVHTGPANRPQIRSLRRANIRPLRKATFFGTRPVKFAIGPV